MGTTTKSKTIHYKAAQISGGLVMQAALKQAIGTGSNHSKPAQRQQKVNPDSDTVIFINRFEDYNGVSFGQLITLEAGRSQRFIVVDDDADFYSIDAMTSDKIPSGDAAVVGDAAEAKKVQLRREFLESVLYFGVLGQHMVVLQSAGLRANNLEAHLTWLLGMHTHAMPDGSMLALKDQAAQETFERLKKSPVKKISIGAPLTGQQVIDPSDPRDEAVSKVTGLVVQTRTEASKVRFVPHGVGAGILRSALRDGFFSDLNLEDSLDDANIQIALEVTYFRKTSKEGHKILDAIATSLRNLPETDVRIDLEGGGVITGDQLKLSGPISVEYLENGLINEALLFNAMHQWLQSKVASSELDPLLAK